MSNASIASQEEPGSPAQPPAGSSPPEPRARRISIRSRYDLRIRPLGPLDAINLAMLGALCLVTALTLRACPSNWHLFPLYGAMAALVAISPRIEVPWFDFDKIVRRAYPLVYIALIFHTLVYLTPHLCNQVDDFLIRLDRVLLSVDPTIYLQRFVHPAAVEFFRLAYMIYFLLPFILIAGLWRQGRKDLIHRWACLVSLSLYANYILYIVFPAHGPYLHMEHEVPLEGLLLSDFFHGIVDFFEANKLDVFPSGHVNAALVTLYGFARLLRRGAVPAAAAVAAIIAATVYLRYHYVADVIAGAALAAIAIPLGEVFYRCWQPAGCGRKP